jgi:hypothetical protein
MSIAEIDDRSMTLDELSTEWQLSVRTYNILARNGVTTLDRLTFLTEDQLWEFRNFGAKGVNEIISKMHEHGYSLAVYTPFRDVIIPGLKPGYQASREGVIKSPKGRKLKPTWRKKDGQLRSYVFTVVDGRNTVMPVDVLVLSAYLGYMEDHEPLHLDGHLSNCRAENLSWSDEPVKKKLYLSTTRQKPVGDIVSDEVTTRKKAPSGGGDVEVYRTYLHGEVTAMVSDSGTGVISVGGTTLSLTSRQLLSLTKVASRIVEVNALMGIG